VSTQVVSPFIRNNMFAVCAFFYFSVRLLWAQEIAMNCSRHNGLNHPFRVHMTFSQTRLVEMVMWQVQYVKKQGFRFSLQFTQCKQKVANNLPALKALTLLVYQTDSFTDVTVNWDSQDVQACNVTSSANHVWLVAK